MDPSYDPKHRQVVVKLECLPAKGRSFAVTTAENGYVLWYYDPKNRIMSPGVAVFKTPGELVAALGASLVATADDDPKIADVFVKAAQWAELERLDYLAKAFRDGGYMGMSGGFSEKIPRNSDDAELFRKKAAGLRARLEKEGKP